LLAISAICLTARLLWVLPTQISAFGITFSTSNEKTNLIWAAIVFQCYFVVAFGISAISDFLQWRHEMRKEIQAYCKSDEAGKFKIFDPETASSTSK
jgi:hypothetical protein